jgi:hypothetical protein
MTAPVTGGRARRLPGAPRAVGRWATRILAVVGLVALTGLTVGAIADVQGFDRTRGGYDPPYEGWTGTPTDWDAADRTTDGFRTPGYVLATTLDCTTGMIAVEAFGASVDFRVVSERAIAVHRPREACERAGFDPEF